MGSGDGDHTGQQSCVQTESDPRDKRCKIMYKVNVEMQLDATSFQVTRISRYTRWDSHNVASITLIVFISSSLRVENIELFGLHCVTLCCDSQSVLRLSRHQ